MCQLVPTKLGAAKFASVIAHYFTDRRAMTSRVRKSWAISVICVLVLLFISIISNYLYLLDLGDSTISDVIRIELDWVHKSWMEYPENILFRGGPSLLDEVAGKPLDVLLVNFHMGVEDEIHAVLRKVTNPLNQTVHFTHTRDCDFLTSFSYMVGPRHICFRWRGRGSSSRDR